MAKIRVDSSGITEIRRIVEQQMQAMQRVEQTISQVQLNLDVQISATENIRQSLTSLKKSSAKERETLSRMSVVLNQVNDDFISTDHELSEHARDVNYMMDYIISDATTGFSGSLPLDLHMKLISAGSISSLFGLQTLSMPLKPNLLFDDTSWILLGGTNQVSSLIKDVSDYAEWIEVLFDNDEFGEFSDILGDISKNDFFKVAGYLGDGKKLIDALNSGDLDSLDSLSEKYAKKGTKSLIQLITGVKPSGVVNSVYLDLGWNLGKNAAESVQDFIDNPSFGSAASGIWNITAGTFFDTGTSLAEDAFEFVGDITGQGFDSEDFSNAMDYLWNHPIESAIATVDVIADSAMAAGEAIVDGAVTFGGAVVDGAAKVGKHIASGISTVGETIGSFFSWW